jgi:hypothetical protein
MARGRTKGQTKNCVYIEDPLLGDYKIQVDESCYIPMKKEDNKALCYHMKLNSALKYIVKQNLVSQESVFTIKEYINQYEKTFNELNQKFNV